MLVKTSILLVFSLAFSGLTGNSFGFRSDHHKTGGLEQDQTKECPLTLLAEVWDDIGKRLDELKKQLHQFSDELKKIPESDEYRELQDELDRLSKEAGSLGNTAREKLEKDILPQIKEEIERLRERLQEINPHEDPEPVKPEHEELLPV